MTISDLNKWFVCDGIILWLSYGVKINTVMDLNQEGYNMKRWLPSLIKTQHKKVLYNKNFKSELLITKIMIHYFRLLLNRLQININTIIIII